MIKAFVVDDEEHALTILELFLERIGGVSVIGRSKNGFDAIRQLRSLEPDVLFLDIDMPEMNGLELAEMIRNENDDVHIVFVTAYDQYAVSAFEQAAVDYILKPLELERLTKAIGRVRKERVRHGESAQPGIPATAARTGGSKLAIRLLGPFYAGVEGGQDLRWRTAKEKEVLAYLALHRDAGVHRDLLIDDIWPDDNYQKAKVYLHTCVSLLRKNIKEIGLEGVVKYEKERYFLDPDRVDIDFYHFKKNLKESKKPGPISPLEVERALVLYQGQLLKDEDYAWANQEIEQLDKSSVELRFKLAEAYLNSQEYGKAVETAERTIDQSPYYEEAYRLLMKGYQRLGRNDQVLLVYRRLAHKLGELSIKPSAMTNTLYENICSLER